MAAVSGTAAPHGLAHSEAWPRSGRASSVLAATLLATIFPRRLRLPRAAKSPPFGSSAAATVAGDAACSTSAAGSPPRPRWARTFGPHERTHHVDNRHLQ